MAIETPFCAVSDETSKNTPPYTASVGAEILTAVSTPILSALPPTIRSEEDVRRALLPPLRLSVRVYLDERVGWEGRDEADLKSPRIPGRQAQTMPMLHSTLSQIPASTMVPERQ